MHVQGAEPGQVQHPLRQDLPVRDDDKDVGARFGEARYGGVILQRCGLEDVNSQRLRPCGDGRIGHLAFSPDGFSRLGNDERNTMTRREQSLERRESEGRRSEKNYLHGTSVSTRNLVFPLECAHPDSGANQERTESKWLE